jgi:hypothetical protein
MMPCRSGMEGNGPLSDRRRLNLRRLASTVVAQLLAWACVTYFGYAFAQQRGPISLKEMCFLGVLVLIAAGFSFVGGYGSEGVWGLLDLIKWWRQRRAQKRDD